jgi:hypothetical protein
MRTLPNAVMSRALLQKTSGGNKSAWPLRQA